MAADSLSGKLSDLSPWLSKNILALLLSTCVWINTLTIAVSQWNRYSKTSSLPSKEAAAPFQTHRSTNWKDLFPEVTQPKAALQGSCLQFQTRLTWEAPWVQTPQLTGFPVAALSRPSAFPKLPTETQLWNRIKVFNFRSIKIHIFLNQAFILTSTFFFSACAASTASLAFSSYSTFFGFQGGTSVNAAEGSDLYSVMQVTASESKNDFSGCSSDVSCEWQRWGETRQGEN